MSVNKPIKIAIFGQYRSGTTGLLYKIKNSLPDTTRVLNEPEVYIPEDNDSQCFVLAKVIAGIVDGKETADYGSFVDFDKKVYIVRDPRDWSISGTMFLIQQEPSIYNNDKNINKVIEILKKKEQDPKSISVVELLEYLMSFIPGQSIEILRGWLIGQYKWLIGFEKRLDDYSLIKYEEFVDNKLTNIEKYLGLELAGDAQVDSQNKHVVRTKGYGDWRNWYTQEDIEFFRPIFMDYMEKYNYENEWKLNEIQVIKPEFCSEYATKTIKMRKDKIEPEEKNRTFINRAKRIVERVIK